MEEGRDQEERNQVERQVQEERNQIDRRVQEEQKNYGADISGMAASGRARLRPPPGFSENPCLNHATCVHPGRGEAGFPSCAGASDANCSMCPNVTANIPMNGDISSGCCRDGSDNVITMGVSHENVFTLSPVPGDVITGTCNCNCNFDINMFLNKGIA